jgi:hypothetical protein
MIKIPFLALIIFVILCIIYQLHGNRAVEPTTKPNHLHPTQFNMVQRVPVEEYLPYHKRRFSLFYKKKQRGTL